MGQDIINFSELQNPDQMLKNLLIGNGLSIWFSNQFRYQALLEKCEDLTPRDKDLFAKLETSNFETCLKIINDAIEVNHFYEVSDNHIESYNRIRDSLIKTVRKVHINQTDLNDDKFAAAEHLFSKANSVFTTNYDLLAYWIILSLNKNKGQHFGDSFNRDYENNFPVSDLYFSQSFSKRSKKKIYYLHGALHLYEEHGSIKKLSSSKSNVLLEHMVNNMGQGLMPIFVSEGNWELKKKAIESNPYLKFCYDKLRSTEGDLTIFGHSLNKDTDYHIIDAIKKNKYISNIAYGIFTLGKEDVEIEHEKTSVNLAFQGKKSIHFFDSSSIFYYVSNWKGFGKPPWEV